MRWFHPWLPEGTDFFLLHAHDAFTSLPILLPLRRVSFPNVWLKWCRAWEPLLLHQTEDLLHPMALGTPLLYRIHPIVIMLCGRLGLDSALRTKDGVLFIFVIRGPSRVCNTQQVHNQYWLYDWVKSIPEYSEQEVMLKNENYRSLAVTLDFFSFDFPVYYDLTKLVFEKSFHYVDAKLWGKA